MLPCFVPGASNQSSTGVPLMKRRLGWIDESNVYVPSEGASTHPVVTAA